MKKTTFLLNLETKKFQQEAKRADDSLKGIGNTARVEGKHIDAFSNSLKKGIAGALSVTAVVAFTRELTNVRKEMANLEVAMETMLGSKARADELLASVQKFAVTTPFSLTEVSQATQTLLTFGTKAEDIEKTLEQLGNVASGVGKSLLDVIEPYGRIMITGKVGALELRSIALRGIPIYEELAKNIGVTTEEINKMTSESLITKQHVVDAFESMSSAGGKFAGLMDKQGKEIAGLQDQLSGSIEELMLKYGKELEPAIKGVYKAGISLVDNFEDIAKVIVELIAVYGVYKATLVTITALQAGLGTTMFSFELICTRVQKAIRALWASLSANPYALIAGAIASATYALYKYITYQTEAEKVESRRANVMKDVAKETFNVKKELDDYNKKLIEATKGSKEYNDIKSEIVSKYGQYLPNLDKEIDKVGNLSGVYDKLANSIGKSTEKRLMANFIEKEQDRLIDSATSKLPKLYTKVMEHYGKEEGSKIYADIIKSISTGEGREELRKKLARDFIWDWGRNAGEMFRGIYEEMDSVTSVLDTYKKEFDIASNVSKEGVKEINNELIKNYEYWEKIKTEAESALKSLGVDAQGSDDWNALNAKIKEATEQMNKYSVEIKKVSSDSEDSVSLLAEIEGQRLNISRIGVEDRLKLLELEKQQELNRLKESLKDKIYSEEEYNKLVEVINEKYSKASANVIEKENKEEEEKWADLLEKFKTKELKATEIKERYAKLRTLAEKNSSYDIVEINKAEKEELENLTEEVQEAMLDLSRASVNELLNELPKVRESLKNATDPKIVNALQDRIDDIYNRLNELSPFIAFRTRVRDATKDGILNFELLGTAINDLAPTIKQLGSDLSNIFGNDDISNTINNSVDALVSAGGAVASFSSGQILEGISSSISAISSITNLFKGKSKEQRDTERLQDVTSKINSTNEITNKLIEKRIKLIKEATNAEIGYNKTIGKAAIDVQEDYLESQFQDLLGWVQMGKWIFPLDAVDFLGKKGKNNNLTLPDLGIWSLEDFVEFWQSEEHLDLLKQGYDQRDEAMYQQIVDSWNALQDAKLEIEKVAKEKLTGITLDDARNSLDDFIKDAEKGFDDVAKSFEETMSDAMLNMIKGDFLNKALEGWYDDFANVAEGGFNKNEVDSLKNDLLSIYEEGSNQFKELSDILGFTSDKIKSKEIGSYQSLSEDTGGLIAGRANAILTNTTLIQGDINNIKSGVITLASNTLISAEKLTEMRDLALTSVGVLERIARGTDNLEPIREDIRDMKNTLRDKL